MATARKQGSILVIDDAGAVRTTTKWMLEYHGYNVLTAESGRLALEMFDQTAEQIDLVLVDYRLPDMDAGFLIKSLRRRKPDVKILICSAFDHDEIEPSLSDQPFVQKPLQFDEIPALLKSVLESDGPGS